jgi:hypothetical protein
LVHREFKAVRALLVQQGHKVLLVLLVYKAFRDLLVLPELPALKVNKDLPV